MTQTIDKNVINGLKEIIGDEIQAIITTYLQQIPNYMQNIETALAEDNAQALADAAHSFKGSSGNLGIIKLTQLCLQLEQLGKSGSTAGGMELTQAIKQEIEQVKQVLATI